jgi:16S rRNA (guanine527-N7)-methyltransferase
MKPEEFYQLLENQGFPLSQKQKNQFAQYFSLLVEWNEKMNLTAITGRNEVYLKHFYDSLGPVLLGKIAKDDARSLVDVGAGAGFPSIPMKILVPGLQVTIVDSLNKRLTFLNELASKLELDNVSFHHARAEDFGQDKKHREQYEIVTARAVARLNVLAELCLPLAKKEGVFLALKASQSEEEVAEAKKAIAILGGKLIEEIKYELPKTYDPRFLVVIDKKKETPNKYPRKSGIPNKKPLK